MPAEPALLWRMGSTAPSSVSAANGASGGEMRSPADLGDMKSSLRDACQRLVSRYRLTRVWWG